MNNKTVMREFDYTKLKDEKWDSEILGYVALIHEYKGRQALFLKQRPEEFERLVDLRLVQSTESSNEIEGIRTTSARVKQLCASLAEPVTRDECEIAGYRDVLKLIDENYEYIPVTKNYILQLHRDLYKYSDKRIGGKFKASQNYISAMDSKGRSKVLFSPLAPYETAPAIDAICKSFDRALDMGSVDALILIPIFIHDFLCIHPFADGNGRMSRLLTTLLFYRSGYEVGRYISLEKLILKNKQSYYDALAKSQDDWANGNEDATPFIKHFLSIVAAAYREFEDRMNLAIEDLPAVDMVRKATDYMIGQFTKNDIMEFCPGLSKASVENSLKLLVENGELDRSGKARFTVYAKRYVKEIGRKNGKQKINLK